MAEKLGVIKSSSPADINILFDEYGIVDEEKTLKEEFSGDKSQQEDGISGTPRDYKSAQELNKEIEESRMRNTYFKLSEIETDFQLFESKIIPAIELRVGFVIYQYFVLLYF